MTNNNIFISHMWNRQLTVNNYPCSNMLLFGYSFGMPLVLLWLSYRSLMLIRSAFEEGLKQAFVDGR